METIILYHRDLDGLASALIAKKVYPDAKMTSVQHGESEYVLFNLITEESKKILTVKEKINRLIIVDFSFDDTDMEVANALFKEFIWIDHHKSAKEKMPELWNDKNIKGIRSLEKSACELCWDYFFPNEDTPYGIKLVGDRDMWKFKYGNDTKYFTEFLNKEDIEDEKDIGFINYLLFHAKDIDTFIEKGEVCYKYMKATVKYVCKSGTIEEWEGHKCFTVYSNCYVSDIGSYALETNPEADIAKIIQRIYDKTKNKWITVVGLRSRENGIDVSKIAQKYKGGGHTEASGYTE